MLVPHSPNPKISSGLLRPHDELGTADLALLQALQPCYNTAQPARQNLHAIGLS